MPETLYLIDGYAQIFRAYYAIRGGMRSNVTGEPTHAIFGFTGMLLKMFNQFRPHYAAVAVDVSGPTFRDDMYESYKGTREATPEDLTAQIPRVKELISLFGIPIIGVPGLEADDVIATIVQRILDNPEYKDVHVRLVSKDKDLEQLLCDRVSMFDIHTDTLIDTAALYANKGIRPDQVCDYLAMIGDSVDNVPGIDGIGPKTASQLIQEFGSLDGIMANIEKIPGKKRLNIEAGLDKLPLSRALVKLKRDGHFDFDLKDAEISPIDLSGLLPFFKQLGFNKYQEEVKKMAGGHIDDGLFAEVFEAKAEYTAAVSEPTPPVDISIPAYDGPVGSAADGSYTAITTKEALNELTATLKLQKIIAVDTETTGLERTSKLCGISLAWKHGHGVYVPIRSCEPHTHLDEADVLAALKPILEDDTLPKCGHNLKFDARMLKSVGIKLRGVVLDSFLASSLIEPGQAAHKLDTLAEKILHYKMIPLTSLIGSGSNRETIEEVPLNEVTSYAAEDADIALRLAGIYQTKLREEGMDELMLRAEAPLASVLAEMEMNGILCDAEELNRQGEVLGARAAELRQEIQDVAGTAFHVDSPSQIGMILFGRLKLAPGKKTKTGYSTDITELERLVALEDPTKPETSVPRLIVEYRQLTKLIGTYLGNLQASIDPGTGRIHTTFHQIYTATGRLASQGPNLQNIPIRTENGRQIRKAFHAPKGSQLICADYSQIELRVLAHLSGDPMLLESFENNLDIHTSVASQVFGVPIDEVTREQRGQAKTINFGIIYGVTAFGLARRIGGLDVSAASALISEYKAKFPGIDRFLESCIQHATDNGYVATIMGRRRAIPEIMSSNRNQRSLGERLAINSVVQGSAADLIKLAMVNLQNRIDRENLPMRLLLQIHDELVLEAPDADSEAMAKIVTDEMSHAMDLRVPLECSAGIGYDWFSAK